MFLSRNWHINKGASFSRNCVYEYGCHLNLLERHHKCRRISRIPVSSRHFYRRPIGTDNRNIT